MSTEEKFKSILLTTLPVMAGYIFLGIAFGLLVRTGGHPWWYPVVMSLFIYSGALEFAAVPLLSAAFDPLGSFFLSLLVSARHLFYGLPMLKKYRDTGTVRPFLIFGLTDETFSILSTVDPPEGMKPKLFYLGVTLLDFIYWNLGTLLGSFFGSLIPETVKGLDFALTALFIVLFLEQLKKEKGKISGFTGLLASAAVLILAGADNMIPVSMVVIILLLIVERRVIHHD